MERKPLDISIVSDAHLGTFECHAQELLKYLKSIQPKVLILNGDFIDLSSLSKNFFPKIHNEIMEEIFDLASKGSKVYYLSTRREQILKRFPRFSSSYIDFRKELTLYLKNEKYWIIHGDVFDSYFIVPSFLRSIETLMYKVLIKGNKVANEWRTYFGKSRMSYFGNLKNQMKETVKAIDKFEKLIIEKANKKDCDYVLCGHVHEPTIKQFETPENKITYMNSGDWVENLTALEYKAGHWDLYKYDELDYNVVNPKLYVKPRKAQIEQLSLLKSIGFGSIIGNKERRSNQLYKL